MTRKERRKNIVVGVLATCAVGVMVYQILGSRRPRPVPPPAPSFTADLPAGPVTPPPAEAARSVAVELPPILPAKAVEVATLRSVYPRWVESPARDPFQVLAPPPPSQPVVRAADVLSLRAIWRQSGGRLAVVNELVLGEGDRIAGFAIEKIDASQVWVRGTNGLEHIDFQVGTPPVQPAKNSPNPPSGPRPAGGTSTQDRRLSP